MPDALLDREWARERPLHWNLLIQQHSDEECCAVTIQKGVSFFVAGDVQGAVAHALQAIDKCLTIVVMR